MLEQSLSESIEFIKNEIINEEEDKEEEDREDEEGDKEEEQEEQEEGEQEEQEEQEEGDNEKEDKKFYINYNKNKDNKTFESWADNNIFFPIANKLIEPLYKLSFTPKKITILSSIFTFLSIYFIYKNERLYAVFAYFFGYLLDYIHDKMLKKNNTTLNYDMALNLVFNNISNVVLLVYLINKFGLTNKYILIIIFMSCMLSINYGLNEAISSQKMTGNNNFLLRRINELKNEKDYIFTLFLYIIKLLFRLYKSFFKEYTEKPILKQFAQGNYCLLVSLILLFIE